MQWSTAVRNARADVVETTIGASAILKIRTGAAPATPATPDSGTVLATLNLPSDWMTAAAFGAKAMTGTWQDLSADNTGTAAHFRIYDNAGTTCHMQGTVSMSGGGGDLIVDNTSFVTSQAFSITVFQWTEAQA
jgi:hypothetical protein